VLTSTNNTAAEGFTTVMLWFVLPLVAVTLIVVTSFEIGIYRGRALKKDDRAP